MTQHKTANTPLRGKHLLTDLPMSPAHSLYLECRLILPPEQSFLPPDQLRIKESIDGTVQIGLECEEQHHIALRAVS